MQRPERPDQASGLRRLLAPRAARLLALTGTDLPRLAAFADAFAGALDRAFGPVLLLDLSCGGLAAVAGRPGRYELMHVMDRCRTLAQVMFDAPCGVPVLPAGRGVRALAAERGGAARFAALVAGTGAAPRMLLALTPPELLPALAGLAGAPQVLLALTRGSPRELTDAYAALKRVHALGGVTRVVAEGLPEDAARVALGRLRETAQAFLGSAPASLGAFALAREGTRARRGLDHDGLARAALAWPLPELGAARSLAGAGPLSYA